MEQQTVENLQHDKSSTSHTMPLFNKIHVFYCCFLPLVAVFSMFNAWAGYYPIAILEVALFVLGSLTFAWRKQMAKNTVSVLSIAYISILVFAFLFLPAVGGSAYVWVIVFPFFVSFMIGAKAAAYWSSALLLLSLGVGTSLFYMGVNLYWPWELAPYIIMPYVVVAIFAVAFARYLEKYVDDLRQAQEVILRDEIIKESEARYRTLLQSSMNAIAVSQQGKWAYANPACLRLFAASSFDVLKGKPMLDSVHPDSREFVKERTKQLKENQKTLAIAEEKFLRLDGSTFIAEVSASSIVFDGKPSHLITIRDITELKRLEQEQKEHEQQLAQMQRLESLGILAGGIAHDFNNLLTVISGNAELLRLAVAEDEITGKYIDHIDQSCDHAADLCRQMLAYAGKGRLVVGKVDLSAIIKSMGSLIEASAGRNVQIHMDGLDTSVAKVEADVSQIKQVVLNFIVNAVDAIGAKQGEIHLRTYTTYVDTQKLKTLFNGQDIQAGEYTVFEITDTGCGIPKALREKIFDPFVTTKATGSGLGLSAVLGIVQAHKGGLELRSKEGVGTRFRMYLPALEEEQQPASHAMEAHEAEAWSGDGLVLVVDDEVMVREVLEAYVQALGFEVVTACDGEQALAWFQKHHPSLTAVVMDVTMPHMGGVEAMMKMRAIDDSIPIVLVSGYTNKEVGGEAEVRPDGFMYKPFQIEDVQKTLYQAIRKS